MTYTHAIEYEAVSRCLPAQQYPGVRAIVRVPSRTAHCIEPAYIAPVEVFGEELCKLWGEQQLTPMFARVRERIFYAPTLAAAERLARAAGEEADRILRHVVDTEQARLDARHGKPLCTCLVRCAVAHANDALEELYELWFDGATDRAMRVRRASYLVARVAPEREASVVEMALRHQWLPHE